MRDLALFVRLQAHVAAFLANLPTDRLVALAEGRASLVVVDGESAEPVRPAEAPPVVVPGPRVSPPSLSRTSASSVEANGSFDAEAVAAQLKDCETLDQATGLLASRKLLAKQLQAVAKVLNIPATGKKDELAKRILTLTVGSRSKHATLRRL